MSDELVQSVQTLVKCMDRMNDMLIMLAKRVDLLTQAMEDAGVPAITKILDAMQEKGVRHE